MTVSTAYTPLTFSGNDATTAFAVTWPFFTGTLIVTSIASTGVETVKTITTHYTVSGGTAATGLPATGTVTMLTAPATGTTLRIERSTALTQASTWAENDPFPQKTIEAALDKVSLLAQEAAYDAARAIKQTDAEYATNGVLNLPDAEASKLIGWNSAATALENTNAASFSLTVGTTTTGDPGTDVIATLGGTATAATLNLTIPRGAPGSSGAGTGDVLAASNFSATNFVLVSQNTAKTLTETPVKIDSSGNVTKVESLGLNDTNDSHHLKLVAGSDLTADRTLTLTTGDADVTLDVTGSQISVGGVKAKQVGKETIWLPAAAMTPRTTNGAAVATTELATNDIMLLTLNFDTTTEEGAGFFVAMPKSWNESTVTFKAFWTAASGSGGVAFGLAAYAHSNDDALDTAVSGQQIVTDTLITANDMHITDESSAITIGGSPAEGDVVYFEITREVGNGSDTLAVDAKLIGIHLYITSNAATDT